MKKIKDFFYNINDVLLVLIIIAIACSLILWRVNIIMDYPKTLTKTIQSNIKATKEQKKKDSKNDDKEKNVKTIKEKEGSDNDESKTVSPEKQQTSDNTSESQTQKTQIVSVSSGSLSEATNSLTSAGLFNSHNEFLNTCKAIGRDPNQIKAATFKIPKGSSKEDIARIVTN